MAGAGYKLFNTGDVLTAAQVNTYLQEQVVMVFADAAARTTALSGVLAEGMLSYLKDTDAVQYYNGSSWTTINTDQTPLTTKGDLFTYSTTDARLAVGNNGETLVADSSQTAGLRYNPPVGSLANPIINGGFDVWQRGTSISVAASSGSTTYTADRWNCITGANQACTVSRQATGDTTNLPNIQYATRFQRNSGQTGTGILYFATSVESTNAIPFAGKAVTLSFYARKGANYSATSDVLSVNLTSGTGTDQNVLSTYTGGATVASANATLTTTWQRFVITGTMGATATQFGVFFSFTPTGTASTNDWYEVTGVQIDVGTWTATTAPTFRRSGGTLAGEFAACQRYYWRAGGATAFQRYGNGVGNGATLGYVFVNTPIPMRTAPTSVEYSTLGVYDGTSTIALTSVAINQAGPNGTELSCTAASGITANRPLTLSSNNAFAGYVAFNAEL